MMSKTILKLTKSVVDKLPSPSEKSQEFYRDTALKGFALRITKNGCKSFVVEKVIDGKVKRITLGKYSNALTVEKARTKAEIMLGKIADGVDPVAEKRKSQMQSVTLLQVFKAYIQARKSLAPKTLYDYERVVTIAFAAWSNKPLASITKDMISKKPDKMGEEHGEAYANLSMRVLRALFNFAVDQYEDAQGKSLFPENPVTRLSKTRAWYKVERRQTCIKAHELAAWYNAVQALSNVVLKDYLCFILFTGLRRQEAAQLKWEQVDLIAKTLTILAPKNGISHTLPLSGYLYELLSRRHAVAISQYVFPGTGAARHLIEPRKQMARVTERTGIAFTKIRRKAPGFIHGDIRRPVP